MKSLNKFIKTHCQVQTFGVFSIVHSLMELTAPITVQLFSVNWLCHYNHLCSPNSLFPNMPISLCGTISLPATESQLFVSCLTLFLLCHPYAGRKMLYIPLLWFPYRHPFISTGTAISEFRLLLTFTLYAVVSKKNPGCYFLCK